ncbi:MAG: vanadium-dependent haloperoxidase [Steroidobacteraceae bacterium]|nr:vanadium-dependent haloperoxidase [Steroidobacteraceae bacterium]
MAGVKKITLTFLLTAILALPAFADPVAEWNENACALIGLEKVAGPPAANRMLALMHTAVYEAVAKGQNSSADAAVAAASRTVLLKLLPTQSAALEKMYELSLAKSAPGAVRDAGVAAGEAAARAVLARRADDGAMGPESYRPATSAGVYVLTSLPAALTWPQRRPWLMTNAAQFRPGPPPDLASERWARDYNEIQLLGAKASKTRTPDQTTAARFWEATLPPIYYAVVRNVADSPGRDVVRNARLYAAVSQAIDDALIAVFDAKYAYNFWRPITAIRNGDIDGNDATERDPSWVPFIETPPHPEYPCAHCIVSATVATVLKAEIGGGTVPKFSSTSYMDKGLTRSWTSLDDFAKEVSEARIADGVHYRFSTEVGVAMGHKVAALAVAKVLKSE